jgi:hypothetical protein
VSTDYAADWSALIAAAAVVATSPNADEDVRASANNLLRVEFDAAAETGDEPNDDPAQTYVGDEGEPERDE